MPATEEYTYFLLYGTVLYGALFIFETRHSEGAGSGTQYGHTRTGSCTYVEIMPKCVCMYVCMSWLGWVEETT